MTEQFDIAALRHFETAECLKNAGHTDDAAYHFGICGETAFKHALRASGFEGTWNAHSARSRDTPMRGHWGDLHRRIQNAAQEIQMFAQGRCAVPLVCLANQVPQTYFQGWSIDIRYADPSYIPVTNAQLKAWENDAADFLLHFVI